MRVLTHHAIRALLRFRLIIQTPLLGSYMRKSAWSTKRVNIGLRYRDTGDSNSDSNSVKEFSITDPTIAHLLTRAWLINHVSSQTQYHHHQISLINIRFCIYFVSCYFFLFELFLYIISYTQCNQSWKLFPLRSIFTHCLLMYMFICKYVINPIMGMSNAIEIYAS